VFNPFSAQPVFMLGITPAHVQNLALGPVELHGVRTGPPLKPVKVTLSFGSVTATYSSRSPCLSKFGGWSETSLDVLQVVTFSR